LVVLVGPERAWAQSEPEITVRTSADRVETEEPFTLELKALVVNATSSPRDPELHAPRDFSVAGPSVSTQMMMNSFGGGSTALRSGIGATWQLIAHKQGKFVIPGPTVIWNGHRVAGPAVTVVVVKGTGRPRPQPQSPFLFPGGPGFPFPWFGRQVPEDIDEDESSAPSELSLPQAPDPNVFLRATVDKKAAVVGEQITLSIYLYFRPNADLRSPSWHDAPLSDFLRLPLLKNPGAERPVAATVGGKRWRAKLLDRLAIFGVRAGDLHTGSQRIAFGRNERVSEDYVIHVTEPPLSGRPPGYAVGDVGRYTVTAEVKSRKVEQGGSVPVAVTLSGTGNLPHSLRLPQRPGVEWLDPEQRESIEPQGGSIAGTRTFGYLVRIQGNGRIDLGEVALPYWDPAAKRYEVARAALGAVDVTATGPGSAPKPAVDSSQAEVDPFATLPLPRTKLSSFAARKPVGLSGAPLWLCIVLPPIVVGVGRLAARASSKLRARWAATRDSPTALSRRALDAAAAGATHGDLRALTVASERAVHLAIEAAVGLRSRGVLLSSLAEELEQRGVSQPLAQRVVQMLTECDAIRFMPVPSGGEAESLLERARGIVFDLEGGHP
jgi:hypothetical protein